LLRVPRPLCGLLLDLRKTPNPPDPPLRLVHMQTKYEKREQIVPSQQKGWGGRQSEVKEEPAQRAGDTNGGVRPSPSAGSAKTLARNVCNDPLPKQ